MKPELKRLPLWIAAIYLVCEIGKDFEFLVLKTDQTILAENIFCKMLALAVIGISMKALHLSWRELGLRAAGFAKGAALGLALGIGTFSVAYGVEFLALRGMGLRPHLAFYISNFSLSAQNVTGMSAAALLICLAGNVLNVWAEEGLFRGLLFRLGRELLPPRKANLLQAGLFGMWHIILVAVWVADGSLEIPAAIGMALGYLLLAGMLGYEWGLCALLTGTLWTGISEHFFNNFIGNALHMVTESGVDELQILRVVLSNVLSLTVVLAAAKWNGKRKRAARPSGRAA